MSVTLKFKREHWTGVKTITWPGSEEVFSEVLSRVKARGYQYIVLSGDVIIESRL